MGKKSQLSSYWRHPGRWNCPTDSNFASQATSQGLDLYLETYSSLSLGQSSEPPSWKYESLCMLIGGGAY